MIDSDNVRSVIEEYSSNIVDGATEDGDFFIVIHKEEHLVEMTKRLYKLNYMCSHTTKNDKSMYCTTKYEPLDEWFEQKWDWFDTDEI